MSYHICDISCRVKVRLGKLSKSLSCMLAACTGAGVVGVWPPQNVLFVYAGVPYLQGRHNMLLIMSYVELAVLPMSYAAAAAAAASPSGPDTAVASQ
jgi:hypothetical protein